MNVEPARNIEQMLFAGVGIDTLSRPTRISQSTALGAFIRGALLLFGLPVVADFLQLAYAMAQQSAEG